MTAQTTASIAASLSEAQRRDPFHPDEMVMIEEIESDVPPARNIVKVYRRALLQDRDDGE